VADIDDELLAILVCPDTKVKLVRGERALVEKLNAAIGKRTVLDVGGRPVEERVDGALVRQDGKIAYAVRDGIPELIVDEGIPLAQLG
jgi:uncharacterized protein YbaR (Trm112 family)